MISVFLVGVYALVLLNGPADGVIWSPALRVLNEHTDVSAKQISVKPGTTVKLTCDGSGVAFLGIPKLAWYGPNKARVKDDPSSRISSIRSFYGQHRKLSIRDFRSVDQGTYTCLGRFGSSGRWESTNVTLLLALVLLNGPAAGVIWSPALRVLNEHTVVSAKQLSVKPGTTVTLTCDGSGVAFFGIPKLAWYGPNKARVKDDPSSRISSIRSFYGKHRKLSIRDFRSVDQGTYTCLGRSGSSGRWESTNVTLLLGKTPVDLVDKSATKTTPLVNVTLTPGSTSRRPTGVKSTTSRVHVTSTAVRTKPAVTSTHVVTTAPAVTPTSNIVTASTTVTETHEFTPTNVTDTCYQCGSGECVPFQFVCDGFPDCISGEDETNCEVVNCQEGMKQCRDGRGCVSNDNMCDGIVQCADGSDEDPKTCTVT